MPNYRLTDRDKEIRSALAPQYRRLWRRREQIQHGFLAGTLCGLECAAILMQAHPDTIRQLTRMGDTFLTSAQRADNKRMEEVLREYQPEPPAAQPWSISDDEWLEAAQYLGQVGTPNPFSQRSGGDSEPHGPIAE